MFLGATGLSKGGVQVRVVLRSIGACAQSRTERGYDSVCERRKEAAVYWWLKITSRLDLRVWMGVVCRGNAADRTDW